MPWLPCPVAPPTLPDPGHRVPYVLRTTHGPPRWHGDTGPHEPPHIRGHSITYRSTAAKVGRAPTGHALYRNLCPWQPV